MKATPVESYRGDAARLEARRRAYLDGDFLASLPARAGLSPGDRVVDLGTGGGFLARALARSMPLRITGIDLDATALEWASRAADDEGHRWMDFVQGDATRVPVKPGRVDAVVCLTLLCVAPDPLVIVRSAREALKPGGRFLAIEWSDTGTFSDPADREHETLAREAAHAWVRGFDVTHGTRHHLGGDVPALAIEAGLDDVRVSGHLGVFSPADRARPLADRVEAVRHEHAELGPALERRLAAGGMGEERVARYVEKRRAVLDALLADPTEARFSRAAWVQSLPMTVVSAKR